MALVVRTARVSYGGSDRLDITWRSSTGPGRAFAPSWAILEEALVARKRAAKLREEVVLRDRLGADPAGDGHAQAQADRIEREAFERYREKYRLEMRASYRRHHGSWLWLLARPAVVLVCYCTDVAHCHRTLLASYLGRFGAEIHGELPASMQARQTPTPKKKKERRPA